MEKIILICIISFFLGILVNELFTLLKRANGVLKVDHTNPEKDTYRLEIFDDLESINKRTRISLKVDNNADLSQK